MDDITDLKGLKFPEKNSNNPPTLICGHGGELCHDDGSLQVLDIPENCMLITFAECGIAYGALNIYNAIINNKRNLHYFEDPIRYKDDLERIFNTKIHIHHPNAENETSRTYVNIQYKLIGDHTTKDDICSIQLSGLVPLQKKYVEKINTTESLKFKCKSRGLFHFFYSASIYPTNNQIMSFFGKQLADTLPELVKKIPVVTQKFLFEKRPGIYFNPLCRINKCDIKHVLNRQYKSSRAINKNLNTDVEYIKNMIINCMEIEDCSLFDEKKEIFKKLDKSVLKDIRKYIVARAKYFKQDNSDNYIRIIEYIDKIIDDNQESNKYVNIISENVDNNDFRTIYLANKPKKQSFNNNLVKVGSGKRRTRKYSRYERRAQRI